MDQRKITLLEDNINQLEDKFASFQARSQGIGANKKENSTKEAAVNSSTMSLRALEHQLSDKIASETAALQRHFDQQLAKVQ